MSTVNLLVEMFELAAGIAQEELALDPDGEAEDALFGRMQGNSCQQCR